MENHRFNVGDEVELTSIKRDRLNEPYRNWMRKEKPLPKVGTHFKVILVDSPGHWIKVEGLKYRHPITKFKKIN